MQAFLREKSGEGITMKRLAADVSTKTLDDAKGRFKLASWSRKSSKEGSSMTKREASTENEDALDITESSSRIAENTEVIHSTVRKP